MDGFRYASRAGFGLVAALASVVTVGIVLTAGFYSVVRASTDQHALQGAGILAQEAMRGFAEQANADQLGRLELGRDTLVTRVRILTRGTLSGAYTVHVGHVAPHTFTIKSTGRFETSRGPKICSVDIRWQPHTPEDRLELPALAPICNGSRSHDVPVVRAHEVES